MGVLSAGARCWGVGVAALCLPLGCGAVPAHDVKPAATVFVRVPKDPGQILLGVRAGDDTVGVKVYYQANGVLLCDSTRNSSTGVVFEPSYEYHHMDIGRVIERTILRRSSVERLAAMGLQEGDESGRGGATGHAVGSIGSALYVAEHPRGDLRLAREALQAAVGGSDTLGASYVPRLHVEQVIHGRWTPLSRYADGFEAFCLAPEDTIRIRVYVRALKALYLRDRVTIAAVRRLEELGLEASISRPSLSRPEWVRPKKPSIVGVGDGSFIEWEFARKEFFSSFHFAVGIRVRALQAGGAAVPAPRMGMRFKIMGPVILDWDSFPNPKLLSGWPVVPTPTTASSGVSHENEFPGAGVYPAWAAKRLMAWGVPFWTPKIGSPEYRTYGPLRQYVEGLAEQRRSIETRNGQAAADSFWRGVVDFPGGDSLKVVDLPRRDSQSAPLVKPVEPDARSRGARDEERPPGTVRRSRQRRSGGP